MFKNFFKKKPNRNSHISTKHFFNGEATCRVSGKVKGHNCRGV